MWPSGPSGRRREGSIRTAVPSLPTLWDPGPQLVTPDGFLCLPLLLDPQVARDLRCLSASPESATLPFSLQTSEAGEYVPALRLISLVTSYDRLWPREYQQAREAVCRELGLPVADDPVLEGWLATLVFEVLPHFVRLGPTPGRTRPGPDAVLDFLVRRLQIPPPYYERARQEAAPEELEGRLAILEAQAASLPPPPAGRVFGADLDRWLEKALRALIISRERQRVARRLALNRQQGEKPWLRRALLRYLRDQGGMEIDGFGFFPDGRSAGDYWVYRRTGEYLLQDYYGRLYLFPDCRVAVSTRERLRPVVWETYKHPFLRRHAPRQEICLTQEYQVPLTAGPREIIAALEAGLNALYYGYNPRRRNGYHSLDRHRGEQLVSFEDYRLSPEDPRVLSGRVEVKNRYL